MSVTPGLYIYRIVINKSYKTTRGTANLIEMNQQTYKYVSDDWKNVY